MIIKFKGKNFNTSVYDDTATVEDMQKTKELYYCKPSFIRVQKAFQNLYKNRNLQTKVIIDYYIRKIMNDTILYNAKWSANDVFECLDLYRCFVAKVNKSPKSFPPDQPFWKNLYDAFRLGGAGIAKVPTNFNIRTVINIINKYNINGNYYDPSCGWAIRLLGALSAKVNYFGTDPNEKLVPELIKIAQDYKKETGAITTTDIRCQGSEIFVPEWEGKIGLIFTSPPYFFLEDYKHGNQSCTINTTYNDWLENFMLPSIKNYDKYLIPNGHIIINIKDYLDFTLEADTIRYFAECGFVLKDNLNFKNNTRIVPVKDGNKLIDNDEKIYVFQRIGEKKKKKTDLGEW